MLESKEYYSQKCLICDKQIELINKEHKILNGGVFCFVSPGYGSCFDSFNYYAICYRLMFCICDECLRKKSDQINVYKEEEKLIESHICKLSNLDTKK